MFIVICEPLADGRARLRVLDVIRPSDQERGAVGQAVQAQRVWNQFESASRQRPELWLWMYRHWRYRPLS